MTACDRWSVLRSPDRMRLLEQLTREASREHRPDPTHGQDFEGLVSQPFNRLDPDLRQQVSEHLGNAE